MSRPSSPTLAEVDAAYSAALAKGLDEQLARPESAAIAYLRSRGLDPETLRAVGGGFLPEGMDGQYVQTAEKREYLEVLRRAGLAQWDISDDDQGRKEKRIRYTFASRLTIPLLDGEGKRRSWVGRSIDGSEPRYLCSSRVRRDLDEYGQPREVETEAPPLNVLPHEGAADVVLICEGHLDGLAAWQHAQAGGLGIQVVSTGGCDVYARQAREIAGLVGPTTQVLIAFDADSPKYSESEQERRQTVPLGRGQRGACKLAAMLTTLDERLWERIQLVTVEGGKDVADALTAGQTIEEVLDRKQDVVSFALEQLRGVAPAQIPGGLADVSLLRLPDAIWQLAVLPRVAEWTKEVTPDSAQARALVSQVKKARKRSKPLDVSPTEDEPDEDGRLPLLLDKIGRPTPTLDSLTRVFAHSDIEIRLDELTWSAQLRTPQSAPNAAQGWGPVTDAVLHGLMLRLQREHGTSWSETTYWQAISALSGENRHHPVREYLDRCEAQWDGQSRVEVLLTAMGIDVDGSDEAQWAQTAIVKALISAAKRVYQPGCTAKGMLVLYGRQDAGKSRFVRALVPRADWAGEGPILTRRGSVDGKAMAENLTGHWLAEVPEIDQYLRSIDASSLKMWTSQTKDTFRAAFGRVSETHKRSWSLIGTTNRDDLLSDSTGNTRYWVVRVGKIEVGLIESMRDQLWGEIVSLYRSGVKTHLSDAEVERMNRVCGQYEATHELAGWIQDYLDAVSLESESGLPAEVDGHEIRKYIAEFRRKEPAWKLLHTGMEAAGYRKGKRGGRGEQRPVYRREEAA